MKKILNSLILFLELFLLSTIILTILNYFNLLKPSIISILKLVIPLTITFISSYKLGINSEKKGYIEGLKLGSIIISIFLILTLLLNSFSIKSLLYYLIILLTAVLSSMIGINRKKRE